MHQFDRSDKLGELGETLFSYLCAQAGIATTKTDKDKFGWDFLVELPTRIYPKINLDAQPASPKALCQIKATDRLDANQVTMSLANWQKLAMTPMPSFVFLAIFEGGDVAQQIYLAHFDASRIGQALKRIRESDSLKKHDLNKQKMNLSFTKEDMLNPLENSISETFYKHIGYDFGLYVKKKTDLISLSGFEQRRYLLNLTTKMTVDDLPNALVGVGAIEVLSGTIAEVRFGIPIEKEVLHSGILNLDVVDAPSCIVRVEGRDRQKLTEFEANFVVSQFSGSDDRFFRLRITLGDMIDILISKETTKVKFRILPDCKYALGELISAIEFVLCCQQGCSLCIIINGEMADCLSINENNIVPVEVREYLKRAKMLRRYLDFCGLREEVSITLNGLFRPEKSFDWINLLLLSKGKVRSQVEEKSVVWNGKGLLASLINVK